MKYHSITKLGLNKARASKINTFNLKLDDIFCHNCYMKIVDEIKMKSIKSKNQNNLIEMILIIILIMKNTLHYL